MYNNRIKCRLVGNIDCSQMVDGYFGKYVQAQDTHIELQAADVHTQPIQLAHKQTQRTDSNMIMLGTVAVMGKFQVPISL